MAIITLQNNDRKEMAIIDLKDYIILDIKLNIDLKDYIDSHFLSVIKLNIDLKDYILMSIIIVISNMMIAI